MTTLLYRFCLFGILCFTLLSFGNCKNAKMLSPSNVASTDDKRLIHDQTVWSEVLVPFPAQSLVVYENQLMLIGEEGVSLLSSNHKIRALPPYRIVSEFSTKDGGLNVTKINTKAKISGSERSYPYVCIPESSAVLNNVIYVFSPCEHTTQLWRVSFDENYTRLSVMDFIYHDIEKGDESVLGPTRLGSSNNRVLFPGYVQKGPALLTLPDNSSSLTVIWQGKEEDGGIVSLDFVEDLGWIILSGGKILRTSDNGKTWNKFSKLPPEAEYKATKFKFRNKLEGYLIGLEGLILHTGDGGKTWVGQTNDIKTSLYKIVVNEEVAVAAGSYGSLLISKKGETHWRNFENKPKGDVSDLLLLNQNLYVLIEGKLYFTKL